MTCAKDAKGSKSVSSWTYHKSSYPVQNSHPEKNCLSGSHGSQWDDEIFAINFPSWISAEGTQF